MEEKIVKKEGMDISKHERLLDGLALSAAEMQEFIDIVKNSPGKLEAITNIRPIIKEHFPEFKELPNRNDVLGHIGGSNDLIIAKRIVELLWDK